MTLTDDGAFLYFRLSVNSYKFKIIGKTILSTRLKVLRTLLENDSLVIKRIDDFERDYRIIRNELKGEDEWFSGPIVAKNPSTTKTSVQPESGNPDDPPVLQFIFNAPKGQDVWKFIIGDMDPHPSIPHGHSKYNHEHKLDSYLGYTYNGAQQMGRLNRQAIIDLWNDNEFRLFASDAIDHFIGNNPYWNWRVNDPRLLPKRR